MILIIGGTTEGRKALEVCEEAGKPFYYSTRGASQELSVTLLLVIVDQLLWREVALA